MRRRCHVCERWVSSKNKEWNVHVCSSIHKNRVMLIEERKSLWEAIYSGDDPVKIQSTRETDLAVAVQRNPNLIVIGKIEYIEGETGTVGCKDDLKLWGRQTQVKQGKCSFMYHLNWAGPMRWNIFPDFTISVEVPSNCKTKLLSYTLSCVWHESVWYNGSIRNELHDRVAPRHCLLTNNVGSGFRDKRIQFAKLKLREVLIKEEFLTEKDLPVDILNQWKVPCDALELTVAQEIEFMETLGGVRQYTPVIQHFSRFDCHPCNIRYCVNKTYSNEDDMDKGERKLINKSGALEFWRGGLNMKKEREISRRNGATISAPSGFYTCAPLDTLNSMQQWIVDTGYRVPLEYEPVGPLGLLEKEPSKCEEGNNQPPPVNKPPTFAQRILSRIELQEADVNTIGEIIDGQQVLKNRRMAICISRS